MNGWRDASAPRERNEPFTKRMCPCRLGKRWQGETPDCGYYALWGRIIIAGFATSTTANAGTGEW